MARIFSSPSSSSSVGAPDQELEIPYVVRTSPARQCHVRGLARLVTFAERRADLIEGGAYLMHRASDGKFEVGASKKIYLVARSFSESLAMF